MELGHRFLAGRMSVMMEYGLQWNARKHSVQVDTEMDEIEAFEMSTSRLGKGRVAHSERHTPHAS